MRISLILLLLPAVLLVLAGDVFSAGQGPEVAPEGEEISFLKQVLGWILFLGPFLPIGLLFLVAAGLDIYIDSRRKYTVRRYVKISTVLKIIGGVLIGLLFLAMYIGSNEPNKNGEFLGVPFLVVFIALGLVIGGGLSCHALTVRQWYKWWGLYMVGILIAREAEVHPALMILASFALIIYTSFRSIQTSTVRFVDRIWPSAYEYWGEEDEPGSGWFAGEVSGEDSARETARETGRETGAKKDRKKTKKKRRKKSGKKREEKDPKKKTGS